MGFGATILRNALLKRRFAENVWQWRTQVSESDTHFQKLSLLPVCSVKNEFFTRKFVPSAQSLQALDMLMSNMLRQIPNTLSKPRNSYRLIFEFRIQRPLILGHIMYHFL